MRHWLILPFSILMLASCEKKHNDGAVSMSVQKRDSLLIEYITREFDYDKHYYYDRYKLDFQNQLNHMRDTSSDYSKEARFKNYQLKSFDFDSQGWCPFAVEITNTRNQFISFFTFTDEAFYRSNSINTRTSQTTLNEKDSVLLEKVNLEEGINGLIKKLNIKDKENISKFIELIFVDLLSMRKISKDSIQNE